MRRRPGPRSGEMLAGSRLASARPRRRTISICALVLLGLSCLPASRAAVHVLVADAELVAVAAGEDGEDDADVLDDGEDDGDVDGDVLPDGEDDGDVLPDGEDDGDVLPDGEDDGDVEGEDDEDADLLGCGDDLLGWAVGDVPAVGVRDGLLGSAVEGRTRRRREGRAEQTWTGTGSGRRSGRPRPEVRQMTTAPGRLARLTPRRAPSPPLPTWPAAGRPQSAACGRRRSGRRPRRQRPPPGRRSGIPRPWTARYGAVRAGHRRPRRAAAGWRPTRSARGDCPRHQRPNGPG